MDAQVARKICELVAGLIGTDGNTHPTEESLLHRMLTRFGLSTEGEDAIVPTLEGAAAAKAIAELPETVQLEALEVLIDAAIVDGKVVPAEEGYLGEVAGAMGIDEVQLVDRIADRLLAG